MPEPGVLVAVAHGSRDPRAAATVDALMSRVRTRLPGVDVRTAYLGHAAPSLPQVLGSVSDPVAAGRPVTVLPLLLTAAYHSKNDIPAMLAPVSPQVRYGATLGPDPLLMRALERRLAPATAAVLAPGDRDGTAVVLAAAGSSDHDANATIAGLAARWQASGGWRAVVPAYASAASPRPGEAVAALLRSGARRVVVSTYLLAPGFFADLIREQSLDAGAAAVAPVLGAAPEIANIVAARYAATRDRALAAA